MTVKVRWACGHAQSLGSDPREAPVCPACGERRVRHVSAPPPRIRGTVSGPYAETVALGPASPNLAPGGSLTLKE